jgi:hypothetical protein
LAKKFSSNNNSDQLPHYQPEKMDKAKEKVGLREEHYFDWKLNP